MTNEILALGLVAMVLWGTSAFLAGLLARQVGAKEAAWVTQLTNLVIVLPLAFLVAGHWTVHSLGWGAAAAVAACGGFLALYSAMIHGRLAVASKLQVGVSTLVPVSVALALGEWPGSWAVGGVVLVFASIAIQTWAAARSENGAADSKRAIRLSLLAGLLLGIGVLLLAETTVADGLVPLVSYRMAIAAFLTLLLLKGKHKLSMTSQGWRLALLSGSLAAVGDGAFMVALQRGPTSVIAAIVALSPAVVALLAWWLMKEMLTRLQVFGIAVGLLGLILMKI